MSCYCSLGNKYAIQYDTVRSAHIPDVIYVSPENNLGQKNLGLVCDPYPDSALTRLGSAFSEFGSEILVQQQRKTKFSSVQR
jgi:hypothetical protein